MCILSKLYRKIAQPFPSSKHSLLPSLPESFVAICSFSIIPPVVGTDLRSLQWLTNSDNASVSNVVITRQIDSRYTRFKANQVFVQFEPSRRPITIKTPKINLFGRAVGIIDCILQKQLKTDNLKGHHSAINVSTPNSFEFNVFFS